MWRVPSGRRIIVAPTFEDGRLPAGDRPPHMFTLLHSSPSIEPEMQRLLPDGVRARRTPSHRHRTTLPTSHRHAGGGRRRSCGVLSSATRNSGRASRLASTHSFSAALASVPRLRERSALHRRHHDVDYIFVVRAPMSLRDLRDAAADRLLDVVVHGRVVEAVVAAPPARRDAPAAAPTSGASSAQGRGDAGFRFPAGDGAGVRNRLENRLHVGVDDDDDDDAETAAGI